MKITFLGTNGWHSTKAGDAICTLIETEKYYLIFDAGEGLHKANKYVTKKLPVYLFLSHLHLDHIFGLHILPRMEFKDRLSVIIPQSKYKDLGKIINHPFTAPLKNQVISLGSKKETSLPFNCECRKLKHQDDSFGFRVEVDNKVIAYCLDTGYCEEAITLSKNCDILVHECANESGMQDGGWGHTNPEEAARVAQKAGAKKLILTHFSPEFYPDKKSRGEAKKAAKKIFRNSIIAVDNQTVKI